jgi:3-methylfumaryl-CoA hydratase
MDAWSPTVDESHDTVLGDRLHRLAAALDLDPVDESAPLRPLFHWLSFAPVVSRKGTGEDGHPRRGGFLPPLPHRRRMFAGARIRFHGPVPVGAPLLRRGTVESITEKTGRTGPLVVVTVRHEFIHAGQTAITEEQDLVYTDAAPGPLPSPPAEQLPVANRRFVADEVALFRFSALTYNSHRIHYDRPYATEIEGYPDLVVHGPLIAILLADLVRSNLGRPLSSFSFIARAPVYVGEALDLRARGDGGTVTATAHRPGGAVAMSATVELA